MNVMLEPKRGPVLIDFSIAMLTSEKPSKGGAVGWSAPEQLSTPPDSTPSSDLFSLGNILFFLLTGERPVKHRDKTGFLKSPRKLNPSSDRRLSYIAMKSASLNPSNRYQECGQLLKAINTRGPSIAVHSFLQEIGDSLEIGRAHVCGPDCLRRGFAGPPDLQIPDPSRFIGKHHARVTVDPSDEAWIVPFQTVNTTAIRQKNGTFRLLDANRPIQLADGDEIALAYSEKKGPHVTLRFLKNPDLSNPKE
jgi:serine/threonine protein kinase